jgi:hypothetical protein
MGDMDDSRPPFEVIVSWIPAIVKGRYLGLAAWVVFIWDHGEPTSRIISRVTPSINASLQQFCLIKR